MEEKVMTNFIKNVTLPWHQNLCQNSGVAALNSARGQCRKISGAMNDAALHATLPSLIGVKRGQQSQNIHRQVFGVSNTNAKT
jgi:hypothetical protein